MKNKVNTLKTKVSNILQKDIAYADDDQRLVARIIWDSMNNHDISAKLMMEMGNDLEAIVGIN